MNEAANDFSGARSRRMYSCTGNLYDPDPAPDALDVGDGHVVGHATGGVIKRSILARRPPAEEST